MYSNFSAEHKKIFYNWDQVRIEVAFRATGACSNLKQTTMQLDEC